MVEGWLIDFLVTTPFKFWNREKKNQSFNFFLIKFINYFFLNVSCIFSLQFGFKLKTVLFQQFSKVLKDFFNLNLSTLVLDYFKLLPETANYCPVVIWFPFSSETRIETYDPNYVLTEIGIENLD